MKIGSYRIEHPIFMAPMDDLTDYVFRKICKKWGADVMITEFISAEAVSRNVPRALQKMTFDSDERPIGIQLYGGSVESILRAVEVAEQYQPDFIDINAGCWVKKIVSRGEGAGLLRDLKKLEKILTELKKKTRFPLSMKTRLGWDSNTITIFEVLRMASDLGLDFVTVHLRTRDQGLKDKADWSWIPRIKEKSSVPIIANGDICTPKDVKTCLQLGADGAMMGRAAIGNPFIFQRCKLFLKKGELSPEPTFEEKILWCISHFEKHIEYYGENRGVVLFRKFFSYYLHNYPGISKVRAELMTIKDAKRIIEVLGGLVEKGDLGTKEEMDIASVNVYVESADGVNYVGTSEERSL